MKNRVIGISVMLFCGCAMPEQPEMTIQERMFIKEIESTYHCVVEREIDPVYLKRSLSAPKFYYFALRNLKCTYMDSVNLGDLSKKISIELYDRVLESDSLYNRENEEYKVIIGFSCTIGPDQYRRESFEYKSRELGKK